MVVPWQVGQYHHYYQDVHCCQQNHCQKSHWSDTHHHQYLTKIKFENREIIGWLANSASNNHSDTRLIYSGSNLEDPRSPRRYILHLCLNTKGEYNLQPFI